MCQVSEVGALLLIYDVIQQHPLGPVQGRRVLHQLHTLIQQRATFTDHRAVLKSAACYLSCGDHRTLVPIWLQ